MSEVLDIFARERCSAILRTPHADAVAPAMQAAIDSGFRIVEFTLTTPNALDHIAAFAQQPGLLVGAGTVINVDKARDAVAAGARFLVSPVVDPDVIEWADARDIVVIPGAYTPTEMLTAHRAGAPIIKLFPGPAAGPAFIRAVLGPLPFLRLFPTNGVNADNVGAFFAAGAFGAGFVADLFPPAALAAGDFDEVRTRAGLLLAAVRAASAA